MYTIFYQPFTNKALGGSGTQKINVTLNNENLAGLLLMSNQIINNQNINIIGNLTFDINQYLGKGKLPYNAKFKNLEVQFNSLDGIQGAILICNLLGKDWRNIIEAPQLGLTSSTYLGKILISDHDNFINIQQLPQKGVDYMTTNSLIQDMLDCFGQLAGFFLPSNIYTVSTDPNNQNVVTSASVSITQNNQTLPIQFRDGYLIYNACTHSNYKRQGLMKSVLIMLINEILSMNPKSNIYLEVDPNNNAAISLYTSLGFQKVGENTYGNRFSHVMKFF